MRTRIIVMIMSATLLCGLVAEASATPSRAVYRYRLTPADGQTGSATVVVRRRGLKVKIRGGAPHTLYTVWVDHRSRATGNLAADYPLDDGALERGVAPAFATDAPVYEGMLPDLNALITDANGNGLLDVELDYGLLEAGSSPVVGGDLATQGANVVGGYWLRRYGTDPATAASVQLTDPKSGSPLLQRSTPQGITIVSHPDTVTHGHSPGVGGTDHFSAFKGDFDC